MSRPGDPLLDAERAAAAGSVLEREYRIADFVRLADRLARPQGTASVRMVLALVDGIATAELQVRATAELTCQRCLRPLRRVLQSESQLAFVASEDSTVPEGREAIAGDTRCVDLASLVEDELLLALPLIARHAASEACELPASAQWPAAAEAEHAGQAMRRPFAELKDLMKHRSESE
ncbi:MAG: YceD family protein [Gammaproteobacteria bacterium]